MLPLSLEKLTKAGEEHKKVVALRPSAEQIAESFRQCGDLLSQFGEASRGVAAATVGVDPDQRTWALSEC